MNFLKETWISADADEEVSKWQRHYHTCYFRSETLLLILEDQTTLDHSLIKEHFNMLVNESPKQLLL